MRILLVLISLLLLTIPTRVQGQSPLLPFDREVVQSPNVLLQWNRPMDGDNAPSYEVQIATDIEFSEFIMSESDIQEREYLWSIPASLTSYFWRVRVDGGPWSMARSFQRFQPMDEPGCLLWLSGDSVQTDMVQVSVVYDQSGNGNHFIQSVESARPSLLTGFWNDQNALDFDGSSDYLIGSGWEYPVGDFSFHFLLDKVSDEGTYLMNIQNGRIAMVANRTSGSYFDGTWRGQPMDLTPAMLYSLELEAPGSGTTYRNNEVVEEGLGYNPKGIGGDVTLGSLNASSYFDGVIAEVIAYDHALSDTVRSALYEALAFEYSPPVFLGADLYTTGFCDTIIRVTSSDHLIEYLWSDGSTADSLVVSAPGEYWVETVDVLGRTSSDTVMVISPGNFIDDFELCLGADSLWDTGLDEADFDFTWSVPNTGPSIQIQTQGEYALSVIDEFSCVLDVIVNVTTDSFPEQVSLGPDLALCAGNTITITEGIEDTETYIWSDGSSGEELVVNMSQDYWVEAMNANGCVARDTISVTILGLAPIADFVFDELCFGDETVFFDNSIPLGGAEIAEWNWDFDGLDSSDQQNPLLIFPQTDTLEVSLAVTTNEGCEDEQTYEVIISPIPMASFSNSVACSGQATIFADESVVETGEIALAEWRFDGQAFADGPSAAFSYPTVGQYEIKLVVTSSAGCQDSIFQTVFVNGSPTSVFTAEDVCIGDPILFTATPNDSISGPIQQYLWDFGPTTSIFPTTSYIYLTPGFQEVSLTVTSVFGCADDTTMAVLISDAPIADFDFSLACDGEPVSFTDMSTVFPGDSVSEYSWFFGSNGTSAAMAPVFAFDAIGNFNVSLAITTLAGCEDQTQQTLTVHPLPTSFFSFSPELGLPPFTPDLINLSENAVDYVWTFDFGQTSAEEQPIHTFTDSGLVAINLVAFNEFGCSDSFTDNLFLTEPNTDLVLESLDFLIEGDFVRPVLSIRNLSNHRVTDIRILAEVVEGTQLIEDWTGELLPDGALILTMSSALAFLDGGDLPFLCAELIPLEPYTESKSEDNRLCKAIASSDLDEVYWLPPTPNPAGESMIVRVVNSQGTTVSIDISDMSGRQQQNYTQTLSEALVQDVRLDVSNLTPGRYVVRMTTGLKSEIFQILVLR